MASVEMRGHIPGKVHWAERAAKERVRMRKKERERKRKGEGENI
jgi:hypothetical protein